MRRRPLQIYSNLRPKKHQIHFWLTPHSSISNLRPFDLFYSQRWAEVFTPIPPQKETIHRWRSCSCPASQLVALGHYLLCPHDWIELVSPSLWINGPFSSVCSRRLPTILEFSFSNATNLFLAEELLLFPAKWKMLVTNMLLKWVGLYASVCVYFLTVVCKLVKNPSQCVSHILVLQAIYTGMLHIRAKSAFYLSTWLWGFCNFWWIGRKCVYLCACVRRSAYLWHGWVDNPSSFYLFSPTVHKWSQSISHLTLVSGVTDIEATVA